ncbi:hypothetical protein FSST1_009976 [Fusarium sambucinum]
MANIGRIAFAGLTTALESTQTLANFNFDFSIVKVEPPREFHDLGLLLTNSRRETAEDGPLHVTARRLGAIFGPLLPQTPELIRCYGLRASEIARESTQVAPPAGFGIFAQQVGIDGASIWAGATSGANAIQVHLLACMLARIWTGPEAISIWVELLKSRRDSIQAQVESMNSVDISSILAAKQEISRDQLGEWDASARAWLRIADTAKSLQQKQLLLIIGNMETLVNSKPALYDSVIKAWTNSLKGMEEVLNGSPMDMRSGDLPLALASWHLYPALNIVGPVVKVVHQKDPLVPESGMLTIGLQGPSGSEGNGLHWSLPLAHLRFYGGPVQRSQAISCEGARLNLVEFNMATLGCVLGGWGVKDEELEKVIDWVSQLSNTLIAFFKNQVNLKRTWLSILGDAASTFLKSKDFERKIFAKLLNLGRRYSSFIGVPSRAFFGLSKLNSAVTIAKDSEERIKVLRSHAYRARLPWNHAIIRYVSEMTGGEQFASAAVMPRRTKKRASSEETKENTSHVRWISTKLPVEEQQETVRNGVKADVFFSTTVDDMDASHENSYANATRQQKSGFAVKPYGDTGLWADHSTSLSDTGSALPTILTGSSSAPSVPHMKPETAFTIQREQLMKMGEEVRDADSEPFKTVAPLAKPMRVVWGEPDRPYLAEWDLYDHWFGEMKHYEHWLGDPHSAAIFIRLDQPMPEIDLIPFAELASLFDRHAFSPPRLAEALAEFLEHGDQKYVGALKAIATMNSLYSDLNEVTIDVTVFERSLVETKWFCDLADEATGVSRDDAENDVRGLEVVPSEIDQDDRENDDGCMPSFFEDMMESMQPSNNAEGSSTVTHTQPSRQSVTEMLRKTLQPSRMSTCQSFSGIIFFESSFDLQPSQVSNVMAMSTGNSLFIAASLLCDPAKPPRGSRIRHVMGNVGKPGMALLVPPLEPRMMTLGINQWHLIDRARWDGMTRDSFKENTLHLWFTGKIQEVDVGYSGVQDRELYVLESAVSLYGRRGEWVADLDILKMLQEMPFVYRQEHSRAKRNSVAGPALACHGKHGPQYRHEDFPLVAIDNWAELIQDEQLNCIFMATGNWQARLAATMLCIAQGRRVCLLPDLVCWQCVVAIKISEAKLEDPTVYIH